MCIRDRLINTFKAIPKAKKFIVEGGVQDAIKGLNKERERQVINYVIDTIEDAGENVDEIIANLSSKEFTDILIDQAGKPIELTSSLKAASPALLALEKALEASSSGLGKERASANVQVTRAIRNILAATYASSDPTAIQVAADLSQALFQRDLEKPLADQMKQVFDAFEAIGAPAGRQAKVGENLQEILKNRLQVARLKEKNLWRGVDRNIPINFGDETPEFITFMQDRLPSNEFAKKALDSELNPLIGFYQRQAGLEIGSGDTPVEPSDLNASDVYEMYSLSLIHI